MVPTEADSRARRPDDRSGCVRVMRRTRLVGLAALGAAIAVAAAGCGGSGSSSSPANAPAYAQKRETRSEANAAKAPGK